MKIFGYLLVLLSSTGIYHALTMAISVGGYGGNRVVNLGLISERQTILSLSSVLLIIGVGLILFGKNKSNKVKCQFCAEEIQKDATVCRYCQKEQPPKQETFITKENLAKEVNAQKIDYKITVANTFVSNITDKKDIANAISYTLLIISFLVILTSFYHHIIDGDWISESIIYKNANPWTIFFKSIYSVIIAIIFAAIINPMVSLSRQTVTDHNSSQANSIGKLKINANAFVVLLYALISIEILVNFTTALSETWIYIALILILATGIAKHTNQSTIESKFIIAGSLATGALMFFTKESVWHLEMRIESLKHLFETSIIEVLWANIKWYAGTLIVFSTFSTMQSLKFRNISVGEAKGDTFIQIGNIHIPLAFGSSLIWYSLIHTSISIVAFIFNFIK